jgi:hypothetical protein
VKIEIAKDATRRPRRRINRHGSEVEIVLEHFINGKSAPYGLLFKARKTGKYIWFDRKQLKPFGFYDGDKVPAILEGVDTYTPNKQLLYEYLDHLISNVLSKRDQKRFGPIYENVNADQLSLVDRLNLA